MKVISQCSSTFVPLCMIPGGNIKLPEENAGRNGTSYYMGFSFVVSLWLLRGVRLTSPIIECNSRVHFRHSTCIFHPNDTLPTFVCLWMMHEGNQSSTDTLSGSPGDTTGWGGGIVDGLMIWFVPVSAGVWSQTSATSNASIASIMRVISRCSSTFVDLFVMQGEDQSLVPCETSSPFVRCRVTPIKGTVHKPTGSGA